jgi:hypothetical protein
MGVLSTGYWLETLPVNLKETSKLKAVREFPAMPRIDPPLV